MDRHIELSAALIFDSQELADEPVQLALDQSTKAANAMIDVDDIVAHLQVGVDRFRRFCNRTLAHTRLGSFPAEDLRICDQVQGNQRIVVPKNKTFREGSFHEFRRGRHLGCFIDGAFQPELMQAVRLAGNDDCLLAFFNESTQIIDKLLQPAAKPLVVAEV